MVAPSSCTFNKPIPNPQIAGTASCAVPLGGSNTTILDTCCNGHIHPIVNYGAPEDEDGCYQYCVTDDAQGVQDCLSSPSNLGASNSNSFMCFNMEIKGKVASSEYGNGGERLRLGRWTAVVLALGIVAATMAS